MDKTIELKNIKDVQDLLEFSRIHGARHTKYNHYTTADRLIQIVNGQYLFLSLGKDMNDLHELTKGSSSMWDKTYIASFAFGQSENIAMWGLYCIPWEQGVRISIDGKLMRRCNNNCT